MVVDCFCLHCCTYLKHAFPFFKHVFTSVSRRCRSCWGRRRRREAPSNVTEKLSMMDTRATQTPLPADSSEPPHDNSVWEMCAWVQMQPRVWGCLDMGEVFFVWQLLHFFSLWWRHSLGGPSVLDRTHRAKGNVKSCKSAAVHLRLLQSYKEASVDFW